MPVNATYNLNTGPIHLCLCVEDASKSVEKIKSVYIKDMNVKMENNKIVSWGIDAKISIELDR